LTQDLRSKSSGNTGYTHKIEELELRLKTESKRLNDKVKDLEN